MTKGFRFKAIGGGPRDDLGVDVIVGSGDGTISATLELTLDEADQAARELTIVVAALKKINAEEASKS